MFLTIMISIPELSHVLQMFWIYSSKQFKNSCVLEFDMEQLELLEQF